MLFLRLNLSRLAKLIAVRLSYIPHFAQRISQGEHCIANTPGLLRLVKQITRLVFVYTESSVETGQLQCCHLTATGDSYF